MAKRIVSRSVAGSLIVALMVSTFVSIAFASNESAASNKQAFFVKCIHSPGATNAPEPCEEKEAKDAFEECQHLAELPFSNETVFAQLVANSLRLENHSVSSFGNTTNLPLYLAKCSFLI